MKTEQTKIEFIWSWDEFSKPQSDINYKWMELLKIKPKYVISFLHPSEELKQWIIKNIPNSFFIKYALIVDTDNDLLLVKMTWS
jgi:hypothetical protein